MTQAEYDDGSNRPDGGQGADEELELLLTEAEDRIERLRSELVARRRGGPGAAGLAEQRAEIEKLSEHLENAQVNWHLVRDFFRSAIEEQRAGAPWGDAPRTGTPGQNRGVN